MKLHMILQGKGGVGKSFISSAIAQYKLSKGQNPLCIDTDPVNATFHGYKALNVKRLDIMENDEINPRNFDLLVEWIAGSESDVVIDNGAATFVPLSHYIVTNNIPELLQEMGYELLIHTVNTGGQAFMDTMIGFANMVQQYPDPIAFVVWLNPYWGNIEYEGRGFEKSRIYLRVVPIPFMYSILPIDCYIPILSIASNINSRWTMDLNTAFPAPARMPLTRSLR